MLTQLMKNWSTWLCSPMEEFETWLDLLTRSIILKWLSCTIYQKRPTKRLWSIWKMWKIPKSTMLSTNILTYFSGIRLKRLSSCSQSISNNSSLSNSCLDSWIFQTPKESTESSCFGTYLFTQILYWRTSIKIKKFAQYSHLFLCNFSQVKNAWVDWIDEKRKTWLWPWFWPSTVQELQDGWGPNYSLWKNVPLQWSCSSCSWTQQRRNG